VFILLRFRSDGLFGRFPRGKMVLKSECVFTSFLLFITFLVGTLFLEPDFHGFRFFCVFDSMVCLGGFQEEKCVLKSA
jgi:hypothetical protein